jgi:HK97 gp10 family phage protein
VASRRVRVDRRALEAALAATTRSARHKLGEQILRESQQLAPYDSQHDDKRGPHLRDSGFVQSDSTTTRVGFTQYYGRFLEMGTQHIPARPFLRPAALKRRNLS